MCHRVEITGADAVLEVGEDQSILDAALRANAWIPHSCTQGTCGTCKLKVLSGSVDHGDSPEYTLTATERAGGLALACMAKPCSDLVVEPTGAVDDGVPHHPLRDFVGEVIELSDIAAGTRRLVVELDEEMTFNAGQYCELLVPGAAVGRQYSMANPPSERRCLEFHVKLSPGGLATEGWIFGSLSVGDRIDLRGPLGQFHIVHPQSEPAILVGGGTGLAPLKSIVRHALDNDLVPEMFLYHGGRRQEDLYDVEFFTDLAARHDHFHYRPALSEETWTGATGLVTDVVLADFSSCKGLSAFLCGPPAMIEAAVKSLKRRRMAPRRIFREEFTVAAVAAR
ncbi:NADH:ubiquinone reductase (Na(+)-transporting) subunit F [Gordonia sp. OPL2]|uniref:NADH:ubiquinone reductase (Na(+)-transporting) subunit F n=1 Tax=Gordonia sp. OPL2 TaxID=2486274 RepID=UPI00165621FE|nr:2Fe-2S iron-sulfur cluster-binding protein [Gordonia sp. OPL2]RPA06284.1 oxidoreductase [Gordonia sp. OPL2]